MPFLEGLATAPGGRQILLDDVHRRVPLCGLLRRPRSETSHVGGNAYLADRKNIVSKSKGLADEGIHTAGNCSHLITPHGQGAGKPFLAWMEAFLAFGLGRYCPTTLAPLAAAMNRFR
ncbi:hypothetical protein [Nonomuraea sp. NPDC049624]|uniref:hypothetical protein n=1 Tax=Nonomuraea sp. NPDC049624 TaxID=3154354 RepID=UPI003441FD8A